MVDLSVFLHSATFLIFTALLQETQVRTRFTRQTHNLLATLYTLKFDTPLNMLIDHLLVRFNANHSRVVPLIP